MDIVEGIAVLTLILKLIPVIPQVVAAIRVASAELSSADPLQQKLEAAAAALEDIAEDAAAALK